MRVSGGRERGDRVAEGVLEEVLLELLGEAVRTAVGAARQRTYPARAKVHFYLADKLDEKRKVHE